MTLHEMLLIQVVFRSHPSIKMWAAVPFWVRTYSVTNSIWIYRERSAEEAHHRIFCPATHLRPGAHLGGTRFCGVYIFIYTPPCSTKDLSLVVEIQMIH